MMPKKAKKQLKIVFKQVNGFVTSLSKLQQSVFAVRFSLTQRTVPDQHLNSSDKTLHTG